ncbi:Cobyrinic acid ac-diamide synthase [Candidatus Promineifilum breve]|uniref:Cobyrinic acid ac-diamide synthase n=1 Tax=Candidatus Promineifilum breve TaxID=1806508 RepID=A0A160TA18_9CHLR|nr:AAA family ATPase [Candidatus Promineifilum breve]CUS06368.1 Cobyrinic acid ac-diamide synthase [Candidatus Promineifilum breve]
MRVFALYNIKGGVGKTAAAVNLAYLAARDGRSTLLWDLDPQGAASYCLQIDPKVKGGRKALLRGKSPVAKLIKPTAYDNLELLPSDFSYRNMDLELSDAKRPERRFRKLLEPLEEHYHTVFLDCPPGLTLTTESMFGAADTLLAPVIPAALSLRTLGLIEEFLAREELTRLRTLAFYSMVDRRKTLHRQLVDARHADPRFLFTTIPYASDVERMAERRAPVGEFAPRSAAAAAYESLWKEVEGRRT